MVWRDGREPRPLSFFSLCSHLAVCGVEAEVSAQALDAWETERDGE